MIVYSYWVFMGHLSCGHARCIRLMSAHLLGQLACQVSRLGSLPLVYRLGMLAILGQLAHNAGD